MSDKEKSILLDIKRFKRKFILNLVLRGAIISLSSILFLFTAINILEYTFQFGINGRTLLFFSYLLFTLLALIYYVFIPGSKLIKLDQFMDTASAAKQIGEHFPEIRDKLLNIIQLRDKSSSNSLAAASISQKIGNLPDVSYTQAVSLNQNNRLLPWLLLSIVILFTLYAFRPTIITQSSQRIVQFNKDFIPAAPFSFTLKNSALTAFKNEDFDIGLNLEGDAIPNDAYIYVGNRKLKMVQERTGMFSYTIRKIQMGTPISFEAAGYHSDKYQLEVINRPDLRSFNLNIEFPSYLNKKPERLANVGSTQIPEGTKLHWQFSTLYTDSLHISFSDSTENQLQLSENQLFEYQKIVTKNQNYQVKLSNSRANNKEPIEYRLDVIPDEYPKIKISNFQDTVLYSFISLGGDISDDHGLTNLTLIYSLDNGPFQSLSIPINSDQKAQRFYYQWKLDSMIKENQELQYYLVVRDNDGFNGKKSTKTGTYRFKIPDRNTLNSDLDKASEKAEKDIDQRVKEAKELKEELEEAERRIKGKKDLNWQDQKLIKDLIERREELNKAIEELKEQNKNNEAKRERFNKQNERIKEKVESLQKLMDELLDEETKKLYEELKRLLEDQENIEDVQDIIDKINNKEKNLEQELERTLELYKKMKLELQLDEAVDELKKQINEQERLIRETDSKKGREEEELSTLEEQEEKSTYDKSNIQNKDSNELKDKQQSLQDQFKELEEKLEDIKEYNQSLENPESMPDTQEEQEEIKKNQQDSKERLEENQKRQSKKSQQKAKEAMKKMAEKMEAMQASMQMEAMQENLDDLRSIVHNLIQLSFDQESLMNEFSEVKQSDPRFLELSQKQLKLKDDSQIVQDSLLALAKRVFQIASFVTREVTEMNSHMDKSVEQIRDRRKALAISEQQFAMTSMNNLALLLDDVLEQMQNAMADAMGKPNKKNGDQKVPSLSELQQQLNNKIEELKGSGKSGRQLSEELAELAAEQERIRKALEGAQEGFGENENGMKPGSGITEKMEETETDLVNKQITQETINRQKEILTRLLEAEDALRERDLDEERKGETGNDYDKELPDAFEEYLKLKEQEIELLKTIPPKLYPYYKNEVNEYFNRLSGESSNIKSE